MAVHPRSGTPRSLLAEISTERAGQRHSFPLWGAEAGRSGSPLEALFRIDSRYRKVWELGFAINTRHELLPGNTAMNETFGGTAGTLHFGLGLTPYTQYHLDIICPLTRVLSDRDEELIGGLYGVAHRSAFFGESMFSRAPSASQLALVALVERLRAKRYLLLDAQMKTPHIARFGAVDLSHDEYLAHLAEAMLEERSFLP